MPDISRDNQLSQDENELPVNNDGINYGQYAEEENRTEKKIDFDSSLKKDINYFKNSSVEQKEQSINKRKTKSFLRKNIVLHSKEKSSKIKDNAQRIAKNIKIKNFFVKNYKKIILITLIIALLLTIIIVAISNYLSEKAKTERNIKVTESIVESSNIIKEIHEKYSLNSQEYYDIMQAYIDVANYDENKAFWLSTRANDLLSTDEDDLINKAKNDAYECENIFPTIKSAMLIKEIEDRLNNNEAYEKYSEILQKRLEDASKGGQGGEG